MSVDYRIVQNKMCVASCSAPQDGDAYREILRYASGLTEDGPLKIQRKKFREKSGKYIWETVAERGG